MAEAISTELTVHAQSIELARRDVADALEDLEAAARRLATREHWTAVARNAYQRRPALFLAVAAAGGFWLGTKVWRRDPA